MSWLNYHHLYYFMVVAKHESFTKAAEELRISQSAVSSQVAQLESFFGHKLLIRKTSKEIALTEIGRITLEQAEQIFLRGQSLIETIKNSKMQNIFRVGTTGRLSKNLQVFLLRQVLQQISTELHIQVSDPDTLLKYLQKYQIDMILSDVAYATIQDLPLIQKEIASEPFCIAAQYKCKNLEVEIMKNGIFLPAKNHPATHEILEYFKLKKFKYFVRGYIEDIAMLRLLGLETTACIAIPRVGIRREIKQKEIRVLHEFKNIKQSFYLITRSNGRSYQDLVRLTKGQ